MEIINKYRYNFYQQLKNWKYTFYRPEVILRKLLETQYWSRDQIIDYQLYKLNKLIERSKSSNYYEKIFQDIILPIKDLYEFNMVVPYLEKYIIKTKPNELRTNYFEPDFIHQTSGSSGDPVTIYVSSAAESYRRAGLLRFLNWWGIKPYDKCLRIVGQRATKKTGTFKEELLSNMRLRYDINVFDLNNESIFHFYQDIENFKPVYIRGYKSALFQFAELLEKNNLSFNNFKFKLATVTAEVSLESERKYIEKILGCKVTNEYGTADAGPIAFECRNGSLHIFEEGTYLNTDGDNNVYITELHNDSMPLINYKNDDKVVLSKHRCTCGMNSRVINTIEGRNDDILFKPNGEKLNQNVFVYIIMELDDIGLKDSIFKWKVVQKNNNFKIYIVPKSNYTENAEKYIRRRLIEEIGKDIKVEFEIVSFIPRDKSGKLRLFTRIQ